MAYGTVKVDNITFDNGGADQNVTVSGIHRAITSGVTVTGTISGVTLIGTTTVSGATITGTTVQGTTIQGVSGSFTSLTGTTTTGTTAAFTSGVFITQISGLTVTGTTAQFTSGTFVSVTGTTITGTTVNAVTISSTTGTFGSITGTIITGTTVNGTTVNSVTGSFTSLTGVTVTGTTASFTSGVFTTQVSGLTVTGTASNFTSGNFVTLSGATATFTSGVIASGTAAAPSLSILSDNNTGIFSPGADQIAITTSGVQRVVTDSSGRLLVGTSSSSKNDCTLLIQGNVNGAINGAVLVIAKGEATPADGTTIGQIQFVDNTHTSGGAASIVATRNGATWSAGSKPTRLTLSTTPNGSASPTERMRITAEGEVLIGTVNSIDVGSGTVDGINFKIPGTAAGIFQASNNGHPVAYLRRRTSDGTLLSFRRDSTEVGTVGVTATATSFNTSSDYRLKENVVLLTNAISRLQQIPVHRFNFIADPGTVVDGFIAHEAAAVVPECVTGIKDEEDEEGNPIYQGIDQSKLVPLLAAALQEAIERIETLEAEVTALTTAS